MFIDDDSPCGYCGQRADSSGTKLNWHNFYDNDELKISAEEFIRRIDTMLNGPIRAMMEVDYDTMYLSDYRALIEAHHKLNRAVEQIDAASKEKNKEKLLTSCMG